MTPTPDGEFVMVPRALLRDVRPDVESAFNRCITSAEHAEVAALLSRVDAALALPRPTNDAPSCHSPNDKWCAVCGVSAQRDALPREDGETTRDALLRECRAILHGASKAIGSAGFETRDLIARIEEMTR